MQQKSLNILICGADGFIGRTLAQRLRQAGHTVLRGVRTPRLPQDIVVNYRQDVHASIWLPRLRGVDVVINAVGILGETQPADFEAIHHRAPAALFEACAQAGVKRALQISAHSNAQPPTPYLRSKHAADAVLMQQMPGRGVVLRPGMVAGIGGASTEMLLRMAASPLIACPAGAGMLQPIHVEDLAEIALRLIQAQTLPSDPVITLMGPRTLNWRQWILTWRNSMGLAGALTLPVPASIMSLAAHAGGYFRGAMLTPDTWRMLRAGSTGDATAAAAWLERPLRQPQDFIAPEQSECVRLRAQAALRRPLMLLVTALIWFLGAVCSLAWPLQQTLELMAPLNLPQHLALLTLGAGIVTDFAMAALTLWRPARWLWLVQIATVALYSAIVAVAMPQWLLHPFGPIVKNLAVVTLMALLLAEETAPANPPFHPATAKEA